jgi:hypothetical protein
MDRCPLVLVLFLLLLGLFLKQIFLIFLWGEKTIKFTVAAAKPMQKKKRHHHHHHLLLSKQLSTTLILEKHKLPLVGLIINKSKWKKKEHIFNIQLV